MSNQNQPRRSPAHQAAFDAGRNEVLGTAKAIMRLPEAKGREAVARDLAGTEGITVESARAILAGSSPAQSSLRQPTLTASAAMSRIVKAGGVVSGER